VELFYDNVMDTFCQFCGIYGITDLESRLEIILRSFIFASIESAYMASCWTWKPWSYSRVSEI